MKKILLILAIVVCVAVAGSALAVAYNSASPITGTVAADSAFILSLDQCVQTPVTLEPGTPEVYTIQCDVSKSASVLATQTATLTITLSDAGGDDPAQDLDDVTVALFSDINCTQAIAGKTQTGAGTISVTGINATTTIYARISCPNNLSEADINAVGGNMTITFTVA